MSRFALVLLVIVSSSIVLACRAPAPSGSHEPEGPARVESHAAPDASERGDLPPIEPPVAIEAPPTCQVASASAGSGESGPVESGPVESEPEPATSAATKPSVSGFPQHDPIRERTLTGKLYPSDSPVIGEAAQAGTWSAAADTGRLAVSAPSETDSLWFPRDSAGQISDGLVRMRVELAGPGPLDVSLLVRQTYQGDPPNGLSGYDLSIAGDVVRLHRWDRGMALPIGPEAKLGKLGKRASLEVVVMMVGPQLLATVYDGDTLEHLASAAVQDTTYAWGCVGLRVGAKHDPRLAFTLLSVMPASPPTHSHLRAGSPRYGMLAPSDLTPFGNTRYVWIRAKALPGLPKSLRTRLEAEVESPEGDQALLFLDTVGYERLLRSGVEILAVDSNAPWSAFNPAFRARAVQAPSKRGRGFVLDDSYKDPMLVEQLLQAYHERYPTITALIEIGRTHRNRPIWALRISDDDAAAGVPDLDEPAVLFNAAHHGSELLSIEYVLDAIDTLVAGHGRDPQVTAWVEGLEIWCVPLVNVDGNHMFMHESRFAIRKNGFDGNGDGFADPFEGVDLNRNYPFGWGGEGSSDMPMHKWYRGPGPGSEPETQAMMGLAERERFAAVLSFHTFGTDVYSAYGLAGARNPKPDVNRAIGQLIAAAAPEQPNGNSYAVRKGAYPVAGSDQDWHHHEHGSIAFVIEGSHHNPELDIRSAAVEATRPLWQALLDRVVQGPWIGGHVRDAAGNPIAATVMIEEIETFEGERWTTRARDGRFDRAVEKPGTYTLVITVDGKPAIEREVVVRSRRVDLDIVI